MSAFFGIGIENPKTTENVGTLWRSAQAFGADFLMIIGKRYKGQITDTTKAWRSIPLFEYTYFSKECIPRDCVLVGVEICPEAVNIRAFTHPKRVLYLLGAEDIGIRKETLGMCHSIIYIPTLYCLNVATAGAIVMYDRILKEL
jgi:tRNA G18 (ribose-2'-O)-methylase SpoU